jgi:hypothetical protein
MDSVEPILYTNETVTFVCRAVAFLFADSVSFELIVKKENNSTETRNVHMTGRCQG